MRWHRLVRREFIPLIAKIVLWGSIGWVLGVLPLMQLLSASFCIYAAHGLFAVATARAIRQRDGAAADTSRTAKRRAWTLECGSALACLIALWLIGSLYTSLGRDEVVPLLLLMSWGLPARCNGPLRARMKRYVPRLLRGCVGVAFVGLILLLEPSTSNVALAMAAREWATVLIMALIAMHPSVAVPKNVRCDAPAWTEFFAATSALSIRRLFYQTSRSVLHFMLGPFGTLLARTGRGLGLMKHADSVSRALTLAAIAAVAGLTATVYLARVLPGPGGLAMSALMLRLGCLGASALLWKLLAREGSARVSDLLHEDLDGSI